MPEEHAILDTNKSVDPYQATDITDNPVKWDGNKATIMAKFEQIDEHVDRTGTCAEFLAPAGIARYCKHVCCYTGVPKRRTPYVS